MESIAIAGAYRKTKPMIHLFIDLPVLKNTVIKRKVNVKKRIKADYLRLAHFDPKVKEVVQMVIEDTPISYQDIISDCRVSDVVKLRYIAIHLILSNYEITIITLGKNMNRDHSTIIHARESVKRDMKYNESYRKLVNKFEKKFKERFFCENNLTDNQ